SGVSRSNSSVAKPARFSDSATCRFRGLVRLEPLPCANTITPVAPGGIIKSPMSATPRACTLTVSGGVGVMLPILFKFDAPLAAARLELEALLDRYAGLAIAHHLCCEQLNRIDRESLLRRLSAIGTNRRSTRRELIERRLAALDRCEARAAMLANRLAEILE